MHLDNDETGEIISNNGVGIAAPEDAGNTAAEDRGDVVQPATVTGIGPGTEPAGVITPVPGTKQVDEPEIDDRKPAAIPKARFDEVNQKRKDAEAELEVAKQELERIRQMPPAAAPAVAPALDVSMDDQERAYMEAMMEGDTDKALEIRRQINATLIDQAETRVESRNQARQTASLAQTVANSAVEDFPYLDTEEGAVALGLIIDSRDAKIARGMPAHQALREAVETIAPRFVPASNPTGVLPDKAPIVDTRSQAALVRGSADSLKQPPSVQAGIGNRATPVNPDVERMDEAQFAALSDAEKRRMRGD